MRVGTECGSHVVANRQHVNVLCALPLAKASAQCDCVTTRRLLLWLWCSPPMVTCFPTMQPQCRVTRFPRGHETCVHASSQHSLRSRSLPASPPSMSNTSCSIYTGLPRACELPPTPSHPPSYPATTQPPILAFFLCAWPHLTSCCAAHTP
jgi:hypothetical protein